MIIIEWNEMIEIVESNLVKIFERANISLMTSDNDIKYTIKDKEIVFTRKCFEEEKSFLTKHYDDRKQLEIIKDNKYETLIELSGRNLYPRSILGGEHKKIIDNENKLIYKIGDISNSMVLLYLSSLLKNKNNRLPTMMNPNFILSREIEKIESEIESEENIDRFDIFYFLRVVIRMKKSIQIESRNIKTAEEFRSFNNSIIFNIMYNMELGINIYNSIDDFTLEFKRRRMGKKQIDSIGDIEYPKLNYNKLLIERYNRAIKSDDPFVKYISYYQIMEYFFEDATNESVITEVRDIIIHPRFKSKTDKDLMKIIEAVKSHYSSNKIGFQGSELKALEYVIKKFVKTEEVVEELDDINKEIITYYNSNKVSFSSGDIIDFKDDKNVFKKIAARIYKTRNSLVHNKSNEYRIESKERGVYNSYKHQEDLFKEIYLVKIISEKIIIKSANNF